VQFSGREKDLATLRQQWNLVRRGGDRAGLAVIVTGRRRVGKSRLVQQLADTLDAPSLVFQATRGRTPVAERADLMAAIEQSQLPRRDLVSGLVPTDWNQALRLLATALPDDTPTLVVIDEVPWLMAGDAEFEGALQTVWDRQLSSKPVLLLLVGSDASVMSALQNHDRAFFGRAAPMTVEPLTVAEVASITRLDPAPAVDAWLITGGFPEIVASWRPGESRQAFLRQSLSNPLSPLLVSGELTLMGEFPAPTLARSVLESVGSGDRTFGAIANATGRDGATPSGALGPALRSLEAKRVLASEWPLSTQPDTRNRRYHVADPYLRFWLAFGPSVIPLVERGRSDVALQRVEAAWSTWRGRAVEPLVRASLERLLPDAEWPDVMAVGGWWNRLNNPEIDLVGADKVPVAKQVSFIGSIKWRDSKRFDRHDYDELVRAAAAVPGVGPNTPLCAVSLSGVDDGLPLAAHWGPDDLVSAWESTRLATA